MPAPPIPLAIWKAIGTAPTLRLDADQWGEHGYVLVDGIVHRYAIDRKEQFDELLRSWPLDRFLESAEPADVVAFFASASQGASDGR